MDPLPAERRGLTRQATIAVPCQVSGTNTVSAFIRNLSTRGIGLVLQQEVKQGQTVTVNFTTVQGDLQIPAQVVYCIDRSEGGFILGARFLGELSENEIAQLTSGESENS